METGMMGGGTHATEPPLHWSPGQGGGIFSTPLFAAGAVTASEPALAQMCVCVCARLRWSRGSEAAEEKSCPWPCCWACDYQSNELC